MTKYLLIIFTSFFGFSQNKLQLLNSQTSEPVSYANIWKENKIYATSDSLGYFNSVAPNNLKYKITAVGYNDKYIENMVGTIFLEPKINILEEVKIYSPKFLNVIQYSKAKKDVFVGVNFDVTTSEFIKFIPNGSKNDKTLFLNSVSFYSSTTAKNRKINVVLYSVGQDGKPDKIINDENLICILKKGKTLNKIDLKNFKIVLPKNGIFVGIQHLLLEENKFYPSINNTKSYCYEPFFSVSEIKEQYDSWDLVNGVWQINKKFSLNLGVEISD